MLMKEKRKEKENGKRTASVGNTNLRLDDSS
jgi:hypothetical protein